MNFCTYVFFLLQCLAISNIFLISGNTIKLALKASPAFLLLAILRLTYKNTFYKPEKKGFYITKNYMPFFDEFWDEIQNYRIDAGSFHKYDGLIDFGLPN